MAEVATPVYITIVCPLCNEVRYRSNRPFVAGEKPQPTDFVAENGAPEATISDTIPLCHECGAAMEPKLDSVGGGVTVALPAVNRTVGVRIPPAQPVQTLFTPSAGETILNTKDAPDGLVVVTSKRIIKVAL